MQTTPGASSNLPPNWAELLNKHHEPLPTPSTPSTWDAPPPAADEQNWEPQSTPSGTKEPVKNPAGDEIEEDHTSCSLSSVGELDGDEDLDEKPGQDAGQMPPSWTSEQWKDWEDAAGGTDDDDGVFMQLSMSEEAEIHNLGIYDEGRRELRGMLRELSNLETMEEGPEGRWALRAWLVRWRHILGVLQSLTDILERRLSPQVGCTLPTVREPREAAQRTRLLGLAGRLTSILLGVANDLVNYHRRLSARLPEGVRLPPRPAQPRRSRSRSRDAPGRREEVEEEDDGAAFVQTFNMEEWQGLINHGILGADIGELDGWLGELALRTGDRNVQAHVRAQHMWSLGVFTRALRNAVRTLTFVVSTLERREVHGGMFLPSDDDTRARVLAGCYRPAMITASIFHQSVRNGVDDAYTNPETLPPRLQSRERPPRRDPGRASNAMMAPRVTPVEDELREGEDGRGRDRTPRRAQERALREENLLAEVAASSGVVPTARADEQQDGGESDTDTSGESWPPRTSTSTTSTWAMMSTATMGRMLPSPSTTRLTTTSSLGSSTSMRPSSLPTTSLVEATTVVPSPVLGPMMAPPTWDIGDVGVDGASLLGSSSTTSSSVTTLLGSLDSLTLGQTSTLYVLHAGAAGEDGMISPESWSSLGSSLTTSSSSTTSSSTTTLLGSSWSAGATLPVSSTASSSSTSSSITSLWGSSLSMWPTSSSDLLATPWLALVSTSVRDAWDGDGADEELG